MTKVIQFTVYVAIYKVSKLEADIIYMASPYIYTSTSLYSKVSYFPKRH